MKAIFPAFAAGLLIAAMPATAAAPAPDAKAEAKLAKALAGRVPGKPVSCIQLHSIDSSEIFDHTAIVYHVGGTLYVNRPTSGLASLTNDDILVLKTSLSQLCNVDVIHLIDRGSHMPDGFVGLGEFVPYTKVKQGH